MPEQKLLVQKYGGTSVSGAERRQQVVEHVSRARERDYQVVIVVSAMGRRGDPYATDTLLDLLRGNGGVVNKRDYDMVFVCGETISAALMAHMLKQSGIPAIGLTGAQAGIYTDDNYSEAEIVEIDPERLRIHTENGVVPVVAGCQGAIRSTGDYTTLGRGGSDTSGVALGAALNADEVEIFTDVEGVARADPRVIPKADWLEHINYDTMLEMARYGAGVMHPRAVRTGRDAGIPIEVRSTFSTKPGTLINSDPDEYPLVGIATIGPLEALVSDEDTLGLEIRNEWEKSRLILSLVDEDNGAFVLAVSAEREYELAAVKEELGLTARYAGKSQSWVSLIGNGSRHYAPRGRALLESQGIDVHYHEVSDRRNTYIVAAEDETHAVKVLYDSFINP